MGVLEFTILSALSIIPSTFALPSLERNANRIKFGRILERNDHDMNLSNLTKEMERNKFKYITYQIGGKNRAEFNVKNEQITVADLPPISVIELQMDGKQWENKVLGKISPWIDTEHEDPRIRELSIKAMEQELDYAGYLGLQGVLVPIKHQHSPNMVKMINRKLWLEAVEYKIWVTVITDAGSLQEQPDSCSVEKIEGCEADTKDTWQIWREFRTQIFNHKSLELVLEFTKTLPDEFVRESARNRWLGEPLIAFIIRFDIFEIDHDKEQPSSEDKKIMKLPQPIVDMIHQFFALDPEPIMLITDNGEQNPKPLSGRALCIRTLYKHRPNEFLSQFMEFFSPSGVFLNFHFMARQYSGDDYSTLEDTSVTKYELIRRTTIARLENIIEKKKEGNMPLEIGVLIIGAGKGPLVTEVLKAEKFLQDQMDEPSLRFYISAVEINQNAALTLKYRNETEWKRIDVFGGDIAHYKPGKKFDLAIGDLFGGLGDTQMMPEVVDSAKHLLLEGAEFVPNKCVSYIAPMHSVRLYNNIRSFSSSVWSVNPDKRITGAPEELFVNSWKPRSPDWDNFDQIYIASLQSAYFIAMAKPLFTFDLPSWSGESHNREGIVTFDVEEDTELIGFAGFFECDVYSIRPETHTDELDTYDPSFIPLRKPVLLQKGQKVSIKMKRFSDDIGMWYEWNLVEPIETEVQNFKGASYIVKKKLDF